MTRAPKGARLWVIVVAAVVALAIPATGAIVGYRLLTEGSNQMTSTEAAKSGTGELRTDLEPLLRRFPALAAATEAQWMSGTYGRGDVPGPSTYWIDAVITLPAAEVRRLVAANSPTGQGGTPEVVEGLRAQLPAGPFLTGSGLNSAFSHERWSALVYLDPRTGQVVLVATGT